MMDYDSDILEATRKLVSLYRERGLSIDDAIKIIKKIWVLWTP